MRSMKQAGVLFAVAALFFTGCAARDFAYLQPGLDARGHYIDGVPYFHEEENSCGPAALASVASYWGRQVSLKEIIARVYLPELRGTLPMDMESYLRDAGFETVSLSGNLDDLKALIRGNVPVISLIDLGFGPYRRPHYVTVIGFDDENNLLIVHDGLVPNRVIGLSKFNAEWTRAGSWMLVAMPKTVEARNRP